ncbi:MAG: hypothetical protein GC152_09485 [Alphaproteobacteria bacterium]|nr:hypothetical protein [Alphaproteobacteria bacterium]
MPSARLTVRPAVMTTLGAMLSAGLSAVSATGAAAQERQPVVGWRGLLDVYIDETGFMALNPMDLTFAPPPPLDARMTVKSVDGGAVAEWSFYPDYINADAVFARMQPANPADHAFEVGDYVAETTVAGATASRMTFSVVSKSTSDDPFDPGETLTFEGPWQRFGYFTFTPYAKAAREAVELHFWAGLSDAPAGAARAPLRVEVMRNGEIIGHNRKSVPTLGGAWMDRQAAPLFEPHKDNDPNALPLAKSDLERDGTYAVTITRDGDGAVIRQFRFVSAGGKMTPHPRTVPGYEPHTDYITPRVIREGTTGYDFEEAFWLEGEVE